MAIEEIVPTFEFDPRGEAVREEPYHAYAAMRELGPVVHSPVLGEYLLTSYEGVRDALVAHETFSNEGATSSPLADVKVMVTADEPAHGRQRRLVSKAFTP